MTNFQRAQPLILLAEGGFLEDKDGITYEGLCEKDTLDFEGWPTIKAAMPLKRNELIPDPVLQAKIDAYYENTRWNKIQGDAILDWKFAAYLYDWFVNSGTKAVMRLQEVLDLPQTGNFGPITLAAVNKSNSEGLLALYHERRKKFYNDHVALVPEDAPLLKGWLNRCDELYSQLLKTN